MSLAAATGDLSAVVQAFQDAWAARFGDVAKDAFALEDVAAVLADLGVPDAALAELLLGLLGRVVELRQTLPTDIDGEYWFYRPGATVER